MPIGVPEAIAAAEVVGATFLGDQRGEMGLGVDPLPAIVAARGARDFGAAVADPYDVLGGNEGERPAHERVRD